MKIIEMEEIPYEEYRNIFPEYMWEELENGYQIKQIAEDIVPKRWRKFKEGQSKEGKILRAKFAEYEGIGVKYEVEYYE